MSVRTAFLRMMRHVNLTGPDTIGALVADYKGIVFVHEYGWHYVDAGYISHHDNLISRRQQSLYETALASDLPDSHYCEQASC